MQFCVTVIDLWCFTNFVNVRNRVINSANFSSRSGERSHLNGAVLQNKETHATLQEFKGAFVDGTT
jgi:hypothetical protein